MSGCARACVAFALAAGTSIAAAQGLYPGPAPGMPMPGAEGSSITGRQGTPLAGAGGPAAADERGASKAGGWHFEPSIDSLFTLTDNVNLAPAGQRKADFVTQLTPGLKFTEKSPHTQFQGTVQVPILLYARTGGENNDVEPRVDVSGIAELVERLFFVEAAANVSQQYLSPFGARPEDLASATNNRYTAQSYRVSPLLKGEAPGGLTYELRDDNIWADESNTSFLTQRSYVNELKGALAQEARPLGWALDYDHSETTFSGQPSLRTELERAHVVARQDVTLEWSLSGGYETNNYPGTNASGVTYGGGVKWRPTDRTTVDAAVEHRFFGAGYHATIDHRTPLSVWSIRASRDITTYPQQLAAFTSGGDVSTLLGRLFSSRITDPALRQTFVDQFIRDRGLPAALAGPLALFTQQVTLQEQLEARAGLIGARNSILGSIYRLRTSPVGTTEALLPALLLAQDNNTQTGGNITWSLKLTPLYTLATTLDYARTVENTADGQRSRQFTVTSVLSAPLSPLTQVQVGARWQRLLSNLDNSYREAAVFFGMRHLFR